MLRTGLRDEFSGTLQGTINWDVLFHDFGICFHKVQVRKHRKKRINKKWAKKYGYKTLMIVPKDMYEVENEDKKCPD